MSILGNSQGTKRTVVFAKESAFGTKAAPIGAKIMPRVETSLNTNFESYQSEEIRDDLQRSASVVGFEKVEGDIKGELAAGQWAAFFAAALRGSFTTQAKKPIITKTTDGSGEKNGKILIVPKTGHTSDSFTLEDVFKDINVSRQYLGCRVSKLSLDVQPNGIASITVSFLGQRGEESTAAYFTNPTDLTQSGKLAGVKGTLQVNKRPVGLVTAFKLDIDLGASSEPVLGAKYAPDVFIGTVAVSGSFTMYFQDKTMIDAVRNDTDLSLALRMDAEERTDTDYLTIILPGVKVTSNELDDGAKNIMQSLNFDAFPAVWDSASQIDNVLKIATTMIVQDSLA
ncbi:phage tail tube protein [Mannheimia indoligenes]|uniref:phage tail tube protein n=1 Tax=Mannheimia indoligenes TaxID=3103145 RepID=UPI002FE6A816